MDLEDVEGLHRVQEETLYKQKKFGEPRGAPLCVP